ncbi:MAG: glycosyltransferase family 2 protein [Candidatus Sericytochromatia bacterium]|nr:glycosyltransferase family 2 protein [Candidatus Sericytochromatia bacterium]
MKLVIQIPCLNEEQVLPAVLRELPARIPGIESIEILVVDDGSSDGTAATARACGVHHVVRLGQHKGLARAFSVGVDAALRVGADIIVNTDADNQYDSQDIPALIAPILAGEADIVVGARYGAGVESFSSIKRWLQRVGSWVVRHASNTRIPDATSGFRAYSRDAAMRIVVFSDFTYTLETLIHAGHRGLRITHTDVRTNPVLRPSRLFNGVTTYILRSTATIVRIYAMYQPFRFFWLLGLALVLPATALFIWLLVRADGGWHPRDYVLLALSCVAGVAGFQALVAGIVADLIAGNRRLTEDVLFRLKRLDTSSDVNGRDTHKDAQVLRSS